MTRPPTLTEPDIRAALEREIDARLARDTVADPIVQVALLCLKCRGLSPGDAHFCERCGTKFNTLVVAAPEPSEGHS